MGSLFSRLFSRQMELVLIGLENSGKTTFLNVLTEGAPLETVPTIGLNIKQVKKGGVQIKCWDLGGQAAYRSEWGRYIKGTGCICYVVDTHAINKLPTARKELHKLLDEKTFSGIPILIMANKLDLDPHVSEQELIKDYITENPWVVIPCSALKNINIDKVVDWLVDHGNKK